jgi:hypothetical protein
VSSDSLGYDANSRSCIQQNASNSGLTNSPAQSTNDYGSPVEPSVLNNSVVDLPQATAPLTSYGQSRSAGQPAPRKKRPFEPLEHASMPSKYLKSFESCHSATVLPVFKVPNLPSSRKSISVVPVSPFYSRKVGRPVDPEARARLPHPDPTSSEMTSAKRFVPLVVKKVASSLVPGSSPCAVQSPANVDSAVVAWSLQYLDFPVVRPLFLNAISFPPSLSQRKQLSGLAIILSGISFEQLKDCAQVSRLFRYAGKTNRTSFGIPHWLALLSVYLRRTSPVTKFSRSST